MSKFEDLLFCNQLSVERFVKFRIPNVSDAEDILQEVFLTAFKNFGQLKTEASFKASRIINIKNGMMPQPQPKSQADFALFELEKYSSNTTSVPKR